MRRIYEDKNGVTIGAGPREESGASTLYVIDHPSRILTEGDEIDREGAVHINFQRGCIPEVGVNGATNEMLLAIVIDRLRGFQNEKFSCRQNALALTNIEQALRWLEDRTREREARGVEGKHEL